MINDLAENQLITAIKEKNISAIQFWLKHRHAAYGTKVAVSGAIRHEHQPLTPEQEQLIDQALKLAGIQQAECGTDE